MSVALVGRAFESYRGPRILGTLPLGGRLWNPLQRRDPAPGEGATPDDALAALGLASGPNYLAAGSLNTGFNAEKK
jgi:hypothetical protein